MKRSSALTPLSHDHHQALFVAMKLRRATDDTASELRAEFLEFWHGHGRQHFRCEEEILLPAFAGHGDPRHPLVARALTDHAVIRRHAAVVEGDPGASPESLQALGTLLSDHVRLEERQLFPLIEQTLPEAELEPLAAALERAEQHVSGSG